jgi:hypothetical protein
MIITRGMTYLAVILKLGEQYQVPPEQIRQDLEEWLGRPEPDYPKLIPLDDAYFDNRLDAHEKAYGWFIRKDNRFNYNGDCSHLSSHLYWAYDVGVKAADFRQYIKDNNVMEQERILAETTNARLVADHERKLADREEVRQYLVDNKSNP